MYMFIEGHHVSYKFRKSSGASVTISPPPPLVSPPVSEEPSTSMEAEMETKPIQKCKCIIIIIIIVVVVVVVYVVAKAMTLNQLKRLNLIMTFMNENRIIENTVALRKVSQATPIFKPRPLTTPTPLQYLKEKGGINFLDKRTLAK